VYQTGGDTPTANGWGCEQGVSSKYVQALATSTNGVISATIRNINTAVDGKIVTLTPLNNSGPAVFDTDKGTGLFGWSCGGTGTNLDKKYLPGSCRGS
jgi:type IV pilus assembly protein PilA